MPDISKQNEVKAQVRTRLKRCGKSMFVQECEYFARHPDMNGAAYLKAKYHYTHNSAATKAANCRALVRDKTLLHEALRQIALSTAQVEKTVRRKAGDILAARGGT